MTQRTDASRESPGSRADPSRSSPDDSARPSTLLTPWHDLDRLARAELETRRVFNETPRDDEGYLPGFGKWSRALAAFNNACTPERILSLLDAAARGAEDTARVDWLAARVVNVRDPTPYGSLNMWWSSPDDEGTPADLRGAIDDSLADVAARAVPPALDGPAGAVHEHQQDQG